LRARWMNPITGRFMSRDPDAGQIAIPATLHKYLYAAGDPVNRVDPSGRDDLFEYAGNVSNALSHYNTANNPNRYGQCQSEVYAGIATLFATAGKSGQLVNTLGAAEEQCVETLLNGIISPVPNPPQY